MNPGLVWAKSIPLVLVNFGPVSAPEGTLVRSSCRNPLTSPSALTSGRPGGLASPSTAVSSMPLAGIVQCVEPPWSAAVTSRLPHIPDPVTYSTCPESKGSIASAPIQWPMPVPTYGAAELSRTEVAPSAFQDSPPFVDRYTSSEGHQRSRVVTITVEGCCGSTARPPKP
jgi:hypothetical protein